MSAIIRCDGPDCDRTRRIGPADDYFHGGSSWLTMRRPSIEDQHFCSSRCAILHLGGNTDLPSEQYKTIELAARAFLAAWERGEDETHAIDEADDLRDALRAVEVA